MLFCRTDNGLEVLGPPQRVMVSANWKTAGEQNASDGFHTLTLHRSLMEIGQFASNADDLYSNAPAMYGIDVASDEGHTLRCIPAAQTFSLAMVSGVDSLPPWSRLTILPPRETTPPLTHPPPNHPTPQPS